MQILSDAAQLISSAVGFPEVAAHPPFILHNEAHSRPKTGFSGSSLAGQQVKDGQCHCSSLGGCCGAGSIPGPGTSELGGGGVGAQPEKKKAGFSRLGVTCQAELDPGKAHPQLPRPQLPPPPPPLEPQRPRAASGRARPHQT